LVVDPTNSNTVYAGTIKTGTVGLLKSTDAGQDWVSLLPSNYEHDIYGASIDPYNHNHLLLTFHSCQVNWPLSSGGTTGANCGVLESQDGGSTWITHLAAWTSTSQFAFFMGQKDDGTPDLNGNYWIVSNQYGSGIWKTTNSGNSWAQVATFAQTHGQQSLYRANNGSLYMGSVGAIYRSVDNGQTWNNTGALLGEDGYGAFIGDGTNIWTMLSNTGVAAAGPQSWQILPEGDTSSTPANSNWTTFGTTVYSDGPNHMIFDPINRVIYSSQWGAGVWRMKLH
jgi:photosystem II stability/assembly factor-like uncharacterized protein